MDDIKTDLGHDFEAEGQECKDGRSRTWMLLLYPDNPEHLQVIESKLSDLDWNYAGRVHDMDDVKAHHHVVVIFKDGRKNADIAKDLGIDKRFVRAWDRQKKAFRYLCHKDNPEKYQYSPEGIYGTMAEKAVAACAKGNDLSEKQSINEILNMLDEIDGYVSYRYFINLVNERGCFSVFRRMGIIGTRLLDEHNRRVFEEIQTEMGNGVKPTAGAYSDACDRAAFEGFIAGHQALEKGL